MAYQYIPPPVPPGYEGNETLFREHQQQDADAAMKRHEESWKHPVPPVAAAPMEALPSAYQAPLPYVAPPAKKLSLFVRILGLIEGFVSIFVGEKKKHTELYGTIRDEHGLVVARRDKHNTPRDRFGNRVDVDV